MALSTQERSITLEAIRHWDGIRWTIYCAIVMPDHVHLLAQPVPVPDSDPPSDYSLRKILHGVKSFSAHQINRLRQRSGRVWMDEREDRIIRDEHEFWQKWQYMRDNPLKAGLADSAEEYPWFFQRSGLAPT